MKRHFEKLQIDSPAKKTSRFHPHALRAAARWRITSTLLTLACSAAVSTCFAAKKNQQPNVEGFSVIAAANRATPILLKGTDADGDPLTYRIVSGPRHGTLSGLVPGGPNLSYTPAANFLGTDQFFYTANDGQSDAVLTAFVGITVKKGLEISNVSLTEGNSGTKTATFNVTMTMPASEFDLVLVSYRTVNGTATGSGLPIITGADYLSTSGRLVFGENTGHTISVSILGDTGVEQNETFLVQLFDATANAVIVNGNGRGTIVNDDLNIVCCVSIGSTELTPENSVVEVGEPVNLSLDWIHPVGWRKLDSVDLLISDDEGTVLQVRWHEAANAFSLLNSAADKFVQTAEAGSPAHFENSVVAMDVQESTGGGPPGQTVIINFSLSFKPQAAGRTFSVEAFATDDEGNEQGFESVGTITVLER